MVTRPACEECGVRPAELNTRGTSWKKRCEHCEARVKQRRDTLYRQNRQRRLAELTRARS